MTEPLDLAALEALASAAYPGPWSVPSPPWHDTVVTTTGRIANCEYIHGHEHEYANAAFIAAARTAVPALLQRMRKLEEIVVNIHEVAKEAETGEASHTDVVNWLLRLDEELLRSEVEHSHE